MAKGADVFRVDARTLKAASLAPPCSKSDAQRALALAYALDDPSLATFDANAVLPADVRATERGLEALRGKTASAFVDVGDGGAPLRILLGQAAATIGSHLFIAGSKRLAERPHDALVRSLLDAIGGLSIRREPMHGGEEAFSFVVDGPNKPASTPRFTIRATESSQFATSLLLAAAGLARREQRAWEVVLDGPLASKGYLDLPPTWLERAGVGYSLRDAVITVHPEATLKKPGVIPGDWSSLGYLLLVAWRSGGSVRLVDAEATHPDRAILDILRRAGLTIELGEETRVIGEARQGVEASGEVSPDLLPTVAALACVLPAPSTLRAVDILRLKESDRLTGIEVLVAAGGGTTERVGDSLRITPGKIPAKISLASRGDHRLAMSAATLAILGGAELTLDDPNVVEKSFPDFWEQIKECGVSVSE